MLRYFEHVDGVALNQQKDKYCWDMALE